MTITTPEMEPEKNKTKISHSELVKIGAKWLNKKANNIHMKCQYVVTEFVCLGTNEVPDIFGLRPFANVLIEVKVSRSDFLSDKKKIGRIESMPQMGTLRYYLVPKGLIQVKELPKGWGLFEYDGKKIVEVKKSEYFAEDYRQACLLYYSIIRRQNKSQVFDFKEMKRKLVNHNKNKQMQLL